MKFLSEIVLFAALLTVVHCQETEEIRRRRQNGVFFGLTGLDRSIPFDLDAFFEQAAPTKTTPKVVQVSRPQRASTTTTTELPPPAPVRRPSVTNEGGRLRLFNSQDDRSLDTQPTFQEETPFAVSRGAQQLQRQRLFESEDFEPEISVRRRPTFSNGDQNVDNFRTRARTSPPEGSREAFRPIIQQQPQPQEQRPVASFDFSGVDLVQPEVSANDDQFRPRSHLRRQQTNAFRHSFAPIAQNDETLENGRERQFAPEHQTTSTENVQSQFDEDSNGRGQRFQQRQRDNFRPRQFSRPTSTESRVETQQEPQQEIPNSQLDFDSTHAQDNGQIGAQDGEEVFDEDVRSGNPRDFDRPSLSTETQFDDQFQSTEGDEGDRQFQDSRQFQDDASQEPFHQEKAQQEPQQQQPFRQTSNANREEETSSFQTTSPDDHSNFPETFSRPHSGFRTAVRPMPQRFSAAAPAPSASPVNSRQFASTIPAEDLPRDRSVGSRQSPAAPRQEFDARAIRKPFQEANTFRDPQTFHPALETHFRTFNDQPEEDPRQLAPSRPTRPTVRIETTGQILPSFVRATEPTDFSVANQEAEVTSDDDDEFTSNRLGVSTSRPTAAPFIRRTTTSKPNIRRKHPTRRPTAATPFESPSSASVARPSEATTSSFRFPLRTTSTDRSRTFSNSIRGNRFFNGGASATENTIDDSFSPGFTASAASRGDSRGTGPPPTYGQIATACDQSACQLPRCFCGGNQIMPGNLRPEEIPQIVILTFDDAVNDLNWKLYTRLFLQGRKNPNGCPIKSTFYVSHEWTDYSKVQNLYANGHEIASHSISHGDGRDYSKKKWYNEIYGQREILSVYANVNLDDIKGMRSPFLAMGGDKQFSMLYETNFTYESSMTVTDVHPPFWPYTLDYAIPHRCAIPPCPRQSYPGFWEIPMVALTDLNSGKCSMADSCSFATTEDGIYDMLMKNFERHYRSNRAPFGLYYHASWFLIPHRQEGFVRFLDEILKKDDVYLVSALQALDWIKNPTPLTDIKRFGPWGCNEPQPAPTCERPRSCELRFKGDVRYMSTCNACPNVYPWVGDTGVTKHKHTILSN